jgi:4-hydroxy-tetrahydrodipicolinate reductase
MDRRGEAMAEGASERAGVVVAGASGRMGRTIATLLRERDDLALTAALERPGHPWLGADMGEAMGGAPWGVEVTDDALGAVAAARIVIDFTTPAATLALAELTAQARAVHVIGTTGFDEAQLDALGWAASHATIVRAGNMSLGVNLLLGLTRRVAAALGPDYDIEIVEAHHRAKVDAPSGTALMLGEAAAAGRGTTLAQVAERGRDGITGARAQGAIGLHAIRGGDVVGEHDVIFAGPGERVVLRHLATDRTVFARGAIRAGLWGLDHGPGAYDMTDVLGL